MHAEKFLHEKAIDQNKLIRPKQKKYSKIDKDFDW